MAITAQCCACVLSVGKLKQHKVYAARIIRFYSYSAYSDCGPFSLSFSLRVFPFIFLCLFFSRRFHIDSFIVKRLLLITNVYVYMWCISISRWSQTHNARCPRNALLYASKHFHRELNFKSFLYTSLCLSFYTFGLLVRRLVYVDPITTCFH